VSDWMVYLCFLRFLFDWVSDFVSVRLCASLLVCWIVFVSICECIRFCLRCMSSLGVVFMRLSMVKVQ